MKLRSLIIWTVGIFIVAAALTFSDISSVQSVTRPQANSSIHITAPETSSAPKTIKATSAKETPVLAYYGRQNEVFQLVNQERIKAGIAPLKRNLKLDASAQTKAHDMILKGYWSHISPEGTEPWFFIHHAGYIYSFAGENLARRFPTIEDTVNAWMESPSHKKNILNPAFQETGIAVEGDLIVQHFATR